MVEKAIKPKRSSICIGVYVPKEMHDKLKAYSAQASDKHGIKYSLSDIVRLALKDFFDKNE